MVPGSPGFPGTPLWILRMSRTINSQSRTSIPAPSQKPCALVPWAMTNTIVSLTRCIRFTQATHFWTSFRWSTLFPTPTSLLALAVSASPNFIHPSRPNSNVIFPEVVTSIVSWAFSTYGCNNSALDLGLAQEYHPILP